MAIYDTGAIPNIDGVGNRIGQCMFVRVENAGLGNLPANVLIEVYRITEPNAQGFAQQIVYAQNLVSLLDFGSEVTDRGPVFVLPVTLNSTLVSAFGVRLTTFPDPGGGSQIVTTIFTEDRNGVVIEVQKVLPGDFGIPVNPTLQAVNQAQTETEMRTAIENPALGLNLTTYNTFSDSQKNQVAQILLNNRPLMGYPSVESVQSTLDFAVDQVIVNPDNIFVQAGSVGGDGSKANPFGTITQGINAVNPGGTVNILSGTYSITSQIAVNKQGITLLGETGANLVVSVPSGPVFLPILITAPHVTINGLTITSDQPYQTEFIQIAANNVTITNNIIFGPPQPLPMSNWIVNRALVSQNGLSGMLITNNTFYSLRTGMYINPSGTGAINNNIVYNTKGGFIVDRALTTFLGNAWENPPNEFDIVLFAGTTTDPPYDNLPQLSAENNNAKISDQR